MFEYFILSLNNPSTFRYDLFDKEIKSGNALNILRT